MDPEHVINLFDSCWFNHEILKKQSYSSHSESSPHFQIQENPSKPKILNPPSILMRSKSDQLSSMASYNSDFLSPNSVLFTTQLQRILSEKEYTQEESRNPQDFEEEKEKQKPKRISGKRGKKGESKSLSDLEFEELKGFMDLGFVFSEEDRDSSLVEIIPGLQRLGNKNDVEDQESSFVNESLVQRPYLSEAWEVLERRKRENPLMNWRVPALNNEIDMKDSLKWWAHTVASTVR